jgi:transcriptional regulator with XRE-family HTH domain
MCVAEEIAMAFRRSTADVARVAGRDADQDGSGDLARLVVDEITWYMREHKVSRAELAQAMKVSPGRVSQILSGDENLTLRTLSGVLAALGAQVDFTLQPPDQPAELLDPPDKPGDFDNDLVRAVNGAASAP